MLTTLLVIGLGMLVIGTITDFRFREVPDWLSFGGVFAGLGIRALWSAYTWQAAYIIEGLLGFAALFLFGILMFRLGQWGGGDSKVLMALGALLGWQLSFDSLLVAFLINAALAGAAYGLLWSIVLAARNWKKFSKQLRKLVALKAFRKARRNSLVATAALLALSFFVSEPALKIGALTTAILVLTLGYLYAFVKAVELACMYKWVTPAVLTEGDWIAKEVKVNGKYICGPKDLGAEKKQIKLLQKLKVKKVLIRIGIPFIPSFLIAYVMMLLMGNPLLYFI